MGGGAQSGKDLEEIPSYWTDDAIVMPPGLPAVTGKDALREYVQASLQVPGFSISWKSSDVTFSTDGSMAFMLGRNAVTMDAPDGTSTEMQGRVVTIWRHDGHDGEWRCVVDIWNAER